MYLKDCITGLKENVREKSIDVIVTSPPYNIGIGSTAVAAMRFGVPFVGFEIDREYLDAAIARL